MIVYCFALLGTEDPAEAEAVGAYLAWRWRACLELGIQDPIGGYAPAPTDLGAYLAAEIPRGFSAVEPAAEIVAAASRPAGADAYQAFLFRIQDALGLAAQLAPNHEVDSLDRWNELAREWEHALSAAAVDGQPPRPEELLGEATLYTALVPGRPAGADLAAEIEAVLGLAGAVDLMEPDIVLWESPRDPTQERVVAALAPTEREDELDSLVWWDEGAGIGLAPLIRYLLNSAKLRYELNVLRRSIPEFRAAKQQAGERVDRLLDVQVRLPDRGTVQLGSMLEAQVELGEAQTEAAGLLRSITRLQELRQTARIASQNMAMALDGRVGGDTAGGVGPLARDRLLGAWVEGQAEHELVYLQAEKDRADEARALAALRLEYTADARARLQNRLTLFQASLVGGLLAVIGVVQTLDPELRLARHLDMPIALLLGAVVFALPLIVVNWFEPYGPVDLLAGGLLGAAAGWLVLRAAFGIEPVGWQVLAGAAGAVVAVAALATLDAVVAAEEQE